MRPGGVRHDPGRIVGRQGRGGVDGRGGGDRLPDPVHRDVRHFGDHRRLPVQLVRWEMGRVDY